METASTFIGTSRNLLAKSYRPKIEHCLEQLSEEHIWWRPNEPSNSIGNLILHLAGNIRQYIVSGAGGHADTRTRDAEFAAKDGMSKAELRSLLAETLDEVDRTLEQLGPADLSRTITVQGRDLTVLEAIYHAVEHFSMHTGQIIYITKQVSGVELGFYSFRGAAVRRNY